MTVFYVDVIIRFPIKLTKLNLRDKTMADKLNYFHNDDTQNYPFSGLK